MRIIKLTLLFILLVVLGFGIGGYLFFRTMKPAYLPHSEESLTFKANRLLNRPIIKTDMHPMLLAEADSIGYRNINGPSLIRVPDWLPDPLGTYYLYFAHHKGAYLRLAYADTLTGPWTISNLKILPISQSGLLSKSGKNADFNTLRRHLSWTETMAMIKVGSDAQQAYEERTEEDLVATKPTEPHIASPDILVDNENQEIRMYYHGIVDGSLQMTKVATSKDGINFTPKPNNITLPYLRVFEFRNQFYGFSMPGFLYRSKDGFSDFEVRHRWVFDADVRHSGVWLKENDLYIFYSIVGEAPERIYYTRMDLSEENWSKWKAENSRELMRPEELWEGAEISKQSSMRGESGIAVNELRDPYVFQDIDDQVYLLYTGKGEQNIGIAKLEIIE